MKHALIMVLGLALALWLSNGKRPAKADNKMKPEDPKRTYILEEIGSIALARVYVDGFEALPLKEKILAYYLYKAAIAGDRILYDQNHKYGLQIKNILEEIIAHPQGIHAKLMEKITAYTKRFWVEHGNHDQYTSMKFVPEFTYDEWVQAAVGALKHGGRFGLKSEAELKQRLKTFERVLFDPSFEPMLTNKSPGPERDILVASSNNLYEGVTLEEVKTFKERYPLNSKLAKRNGQLVELVYRAGGNGIKPSLYAKELGRVIEYLGRAVEYAEPQQQQTLRHLIKYFKSGEAEDFRTYNIAWVQDNPTVDTINGFIEVYRDARAAKGAYEGVVYFIDRKTTKIMRDLADNAQYFESRMPWSDEYKKKNIKPPVANTVTVLIETGDSGPVSPVGINLPNEQAIRQRYGSKNIMLVNINQASEHINAARMGGVFSYSEEEKELSEKYGDLASLIHTGLHEVVGHGSGRVSDRLKEDPRVYLKEYYSTLEEARADLVGLWQLYDPKLIELGILPNEKAAEAGYRRYVRGVLAQLRRVPKSDQLEEDHMRARQMIVNYVKDVTKAIDVKEKNGDVYLVINDFKKMRQGVGELLSEIMRIKAEGDYAAIKKLVDTYGTRINPQWRDNVVARAKKANIPSLIAFVYPKLELVKDANGAITDVKWSYYNSFTEEQLDFKKEYRGLD